MPETLFHGLILASDAELICREQGWEPPADGWDKMRAELEYLYGSAAEFRRTALDNAEILGLKRSSAQQGSLLEII
jgi:hypothetical protein